MDLNVSNHLYIIKMESTIHHYHYHYHYYYHDGGEEKTQGDITLSGDRLTKSNDRFAKSDDRLTTKTAESHIGEAFMPPPTGYIPHGPEILSKDRGILSSYGYKNVKDQTLKYRRMVLAEATQYISKEYIQERLYYIAKAQTNQSDNPFKEDLEWFESMYHLSPFTTTGP
jgi:hypothetical protein